MTTAFLIDIESAGAGFDSLARTTADADASQEFRRWCGRADGFAAHLILLRDKGPLALGEAVWADLDRMSDRFGIHPESSNTHSNGTIESIQKSA